MIDPETRELNIAGRPFLNPCPHCLQDFGGRVMLYRHRKGKRSERYHSRRTRCLSAEEMMERGWYLDKFGRWRDSRMRKKRGVSPPLC
jgi:hypothetical protein